MNPYHSWRTPALILTAALAFGAALAPSARATSFTLNDAVAHSVIVQGNVGGDYNGMPLFYKGENSGFEDGTQEGKDLFTSSMGAGNLSMIISWGSAPAPDLDLVLMKAGNYYVTWDLSGVDLSAYDSLQLVNDIIRNPRGFSHPLLGISHANIYGDPGSDPGVPLPDSGSMAALMLIGLGSVACAKRSLAR